MDMFVLDRLQKKLNDAGIDDHRIIAGVRLTTAGYHKLADAMGVSFREINNMINELIVKLRSTDDPILNEDNGFERFSYERDFMENVTIRDLDTGHETFLRGGEAAELLNALALHPEQEQTLLAYYMEDSLNESVVSEDDVDSYLPEIENNRGSYNFPWSLDDRRRGTATVEFSGNGEMKLKLVSIRDEDGEEIGLDYNDVERLKEIAIDFIDKV